MAFTLRPQPRFTRKSKKLVQPGSALAERFGRTLTLLAKNPAAPSLRTHKVNLAGVKVYSSSVTGDVRIIWRYADGVLYRPAGCRRS